MVGQSRTNPNSAVNQSTMKSSFKLALLILLIPASCKDFFAQGWRGIVPGRSTRTDIVRLLNRCSDPQEACDFCLEQEQVYILFSGSLPREYGACSQSLPLDTVMFIGIESSSVRQLSDLHLDKKKLKAFNPTDPYKLGYKVYFDGNKGLVIPTFKGKVISVYYIANQEDKVFCPAYYGNPVAFAEVYRGHVPVVYVSCPTNNPVAGEKVVISAFTDINTRRGFTWTVSSGRIIAGQEHQHHHLRYDRTCRADLNGDC